MKKYVKNSFGRYGGVIVLVVFFVLLISLSVGGALYVFYGDSWFGRNQADVVQTANQDYGTCVFSIETKSIKVKSNERKTIKIKSNDENASKAIKWTSSDKNTAFVDQDGTVIGLKKGNVKITATAGYYSSTCDVQVTSNPTEVPKGYSTAFTANEVTLKKNKNNGSGINLYSIDVNRKKNCVTVYTYDKDGKYTVPVRAMICSCGDGDNTPKGTFSIFVKNRWHPLFGDVYGQYVTGFNNDILFHSVPYEKMNQPETVEVQDYNGLGTSISMGCVRLAVADAKWIYENCDFGTTVRVYESDKDGPLGTPKSMKINENKTVYWDPTDNDKDNPYYSKAPTFTGADNVTVELGEYFDSMKNVSAKDTSGSSIDKSNIKVNGKVNTDKAGDYLIIYTVSDDMGRSTTQYRVVTVK